MNKTNENRVVKLSEIGILIGGNGFPLQYQGNDDGVYPFYKVSDMNSLGNEIYMKESNNYVNNDVVNNLKLNVLPKNAIVFAKVGAAVMLERKRLLSKDSIIDNNMMALIVNDKFYYKYIYHSLVNENYTCCLILELCPL